MVLGFFFLFLSVCVFVFFSSCLALGLAWPDTLRSRSAGIWCKIKISGRKVREGGRHGKSEFNLGGFFFLLFGEVRVWLV